MNSRLRLLPAAATAVAALALPAGAHAYRDWSQTLGSSLALNQVDDTIQCHGCTFAMDAIGTQIYVDTEWASDQMIITSFKAKLAAGTTATLRSFTRGGYGAMTPVATGETVHGTGKLETYESHLWVKRNETIGLDLDGSIDAITGSGTIRVLDDGTPNGTESTTDGYDLEPMLQATVEQDDDTDHLGDRTQDPCYYSCDSTTKPPSGGSGGRGGDVPPPSNTSGGGSSTAGGSTGGGSSTGGSSSAPTAGRDPGTIRSRRTFTIQDSGWMSKGKHPVVTASVFNPHNDSVSGTATLKVAGKPVARARVFAITQDDADFKVTPKVAKAIAKGAKVTVAATVSSDEQGKETDSTPVKVAAAKTTAFDGTYRGSGPLVIKVQGGLVTTATKSLFLTSTKGSGNLTRAFSLPAGVPAIVSKSGAVKVSGDFGSDQVKFNATFKKDGTAKGYLSDWYTTFGSSSDGRFVTDPYFAASNWTAKK